MVTVELHIFAQTMTLFISLANVAYFFYIYKWGVKKHLMKWEVIWVAAVESVNYMIQLCTQSQRVALAGERFFPWSRYVAWQLTCPVLLSFIIVNILNNNSPRINVQLLMLLQGILLSGMTASLFADMHLKILFVCIAAVGLLFMDYFLLCNRSRHEATGEKSTHLLLYFMISWTIFPFLFILGPEMTNAISFEFTLIGHAVGDLLSKNLFSILSWNYLLYVDVHTANDEQDKSVTSPSEVSTLRQAASEVSTPRRAAWSDTERGHQYQVRDAGHMRRTTSTKKCDENAHEHTDDMEEITLEEEANDMEAGTRGVEYVTKLEARFAKLMAEREKYFKTHPIALPMGLQSPFSVVANGGTLKS